MEYMFQPGFLGTKAPLFMDIVILLLAALPLMSAGAIYLARLKKYGLHMALNIVLFFVMVLVVGYFEYGVLLAGAYSAQGSLGQIIWILGIHIVIAMVTIALWANVLYNASKHFENGLPGPRSKRHRRAGLRVFAGIVLTALLGIWIYLLLYTGS